MTGFRTYRFTIATAAVLALLSSGCGKAAKTKWQAHMATWFNNSSLQPPEPEHGRWERREWDRFLLRIGHADIAVVGSLKVLTVFSVFKTPKNVSLQFQATETLHGSLRDGPRSLVLTLSEGDDDFEIAVRAQKHVAGQRFLLFLKTQPQHRKWGPPKGWRGSLWRKGPKAPQAYRWVLYRPDAALLTRVRTMYRWLKQKR